MGLRDIIECLMPPLSTIVSFEVEMSPSSSRTYLWDTATGEIVPQYRGHFPPEAPVAGSEGQLRWYAPNDLRHTKRFTFSQDAEGYRMEKPPFEVTEDGRMLLRCRLPETAYVP